ncbi:MAG: nodulation protein NfeD [Thermodesulfobacteria bacterium]|nr:nodulation protein NfeD [Thermodesulfobacteriota bacterium]
MKGSNVKKNLKERCYLFNFSLFLLTLLILSLALSNGSAKEEPTTLTGPVVAIKIDSAINPASNELLNRGIKAAQSYKASTLLVLLDTPGGLVTSARKMIQALMSSPVPVTVFVYPQGARAASAGALITLASDVAAMAPGTNIGAAHPVVMGGKIDSNSTMYKKMENDLAAFAVSIATKRGRNRKWAEEAVRKSISTPAQEALKLHVIDLIAQDVPDLIKKLKDRKIRMGNGKTVILNPSSPSPIYLEETLRERILQIIADPNVAYILMMVGMLGIYFELAHPGVILPGAVGTLCLLLSLYALHTLSASTTAILLILFSFLLFILELFITSHGILAISGAVSLAIGSIMLFGSDSQIAISKSVLWPTLLTVIGFFLVIAILAAKAALSKPKTGTEGLIEATGTVQRVLSSSRYLVHVHGELWEAYGPPGLKRGDEVCVKEIKGLRLKIEKTEQQED